MREWKYLEYIAVLVLLFTYFGYFAIKVWDIDFWWHIAAGKNMLETGAIPVTDPFGVYDAANMWGQAVLRSQWLGQVILYLVFNSFDLDGIILLRAAVLTLCLAIVYLRCRIDETTNLFALLITALAGMAILPHTGERPQLFSFLYLSLTFLLLDGYMRNAKRWLLYCIPLVILLWSNTHAGSVLGVVAMGLFASGLLLENRRSGEPLFTSNAQLILKMLALSVAALVCTPNSFATIHRIIFVENVFFVGDNPLRDRVSEYAYPWTVWSSTKYYWVFIGVALVSLPGFFGRKYWKQGIVVFTIALISLTAYRYIPLFVLLAAPYVAASLNRFCRVRLSVLAVNLFALVASLSFSIYGYVQGDTFQHGIQERRFPQGALAFIKASHLGGKVFNSMNWGGFLTWNLKGKVTVFIDGRMLDPRRLVQYTHILWTTPEGREFFEQGNFDMVLLPYGNEFSGEKYPVLTYLINHPAWQVAYQDSLGFLFVRRLNE